MVKGSMGGSTMSAILPCLCLVVHPGVDGVGSLEVAEVQIGHLRPVEVSVTPHEIRPERDAQPGPERVRRLERHLGIRARQRRPERGMRPVDLAQAETFQAQRLRHRLRGFTARAVVGHGQRGRKAGG